MNNQKPVPMSTFNALQFGYQSKRDSIMFLNS